MFCCRYYNVEYTCKFAMRDADLEHAAISLVTDVEGESSNHMIVHQYFREGIQYNYSVCLGGAWHGGLVSPEWWVEWMESNIIFGAELIMIHNMSMPHSMDPYVEYYTKRGLLEVLPWNVDRIMEKGGTRSHLQLALINDCLYRLRRRARYMVQIDQDELIVPRHTGDVTWADMIRRSGCVPDAGVYGARQLFYGLHYSNNTHNANTTSLVTLDATQRSKEVLEYSTRSKYITNTFTTTLVRTHHASGDESVPICTLPPDVGANHHYCLRVPTFDEHHGTVIDNSTHKYKEMLTRRVSNTMKIVNNHI